MDMVSEKKKQTLKEIREELSKYPVIGIIDMYKLPGRQLHDIRNKLRKDAVIRMVKKRIILFALKDCGLKGIDELEKHIKGEPALMFSKTNPFKLARTISESKSKAFAKEGDIAPMDIVVRAGPTSLPPGPVIGELQRAKIPASVEGEKIAVREDTVVAREGDTINRTLADVLAKLNIEPMEIGLSLNAVWENGYVYSRDILFTPVEKYLDDMKTASSQAFNLAYNVNYYTKENIPLFLSKAHQEALALAMEANFITKETADKLLVKAKAQAETIKGMVKDAPEEAKEEAKEGKKEEAEENKEEKKEEKKETEKKKETKEGKKTEKKDSKKTNKDKKNDGQKKKEKEG